jgi:hypothetical protein
MTAAQLPRPWYCIDSLVDDYLTIHKSGGDLRMLKALKIVRAIIVNIGLISITLYSLSQTADPTLIGSIGLVSLAAYNGVEIADYQALAQAIVEASEESTHSDE